MSKVRQAFILRGKQLGLAGTALLVFVNNAMAALPTDAQAAFDALKGNATDIQAAVWPIIILLTSGWFLMKLFKKGASKAG